MDILHAALLGIIEGLTEFIPVSSTGHLILASALLGLEDARVKTFEVFIQLGAILAVLILYYDRFLALLPTRENSAVDTGLTGRTGLLKIMLACLPALGCGALFHSTIKAYLFQPQTVAIALIVGGLILLVVEKKAPPASATSIDQVSFRQSLVIGVFQVFSLWPGVSRSGATIVGGILTGLPRTVAAEFSFLISVPIMFAAVAFDLWKSWALLSRDDLPFFAVGFLVSMLTAILAIRFFLSLLKRFTLAPFGIYRIVLGIAVLVLIK